MATEAKDINTALHLREISIAKHTNLELLVLLLLLSSERVVHEKCDLRKNNIFHTSVICPPHDLAGFVRCHVHNRCSFVLLCLN